MSNLAERVIDLLNRLETDPIFTEFMAEMQCHGLIVDRLIGKRKNSSLNNYLITELGLAIYANDGKVFDVHFDLVGEARKDGILMKQYSGTLPFGLRVDCARHDVGRILQQPRVASHVASFDANLVIDAYEMGSFKVRCTFFHQTEKLNDLQVMCSILDAPKTKL
jgi:hypothetical protein